YPNQLRDHKRLWYQSRYSRNGKNSYTEEVCAIAPRITAAKENTGTRHSPRGGNCRCAGAAISRVWRRNERAGCAPASSGGASPSSSRRAKYRAGGSEFRGRRYDGRGGGPRGIRVGRVSNAECTGHHGGKFWTAAGRKRSGCSTGKDRHIFQQ